jgi:hypothetical protein
VSAVATGDSAAAVIPAADDAAAAAAAAAATAAAAILAAADAADAAGAAAAAADAAAVPAAADATLLQLLRLPLPMRTLQQIKQHIITRNANRKCIWTWKCKNKTAARHEREGNAKDRTGKTNTNHAKQTKTRCIHVANKQRTGHLTRISISPCLQSLLLLPMLLLPMLLRFLLLPMLHCCSCFHARYQYERCNKSNNTSSHETQTESAYGLGNVRIRERHGMSEKETQKTGQGKRIPIIQNKQRPDIHVANKQ